MKKTVINHFSLFVIATFLLISCESKQPLAVDKATVDMKVEGMVCAMGCAKYIEDQVAELDGVLKSEVNFEDGMAMFEFDKNVVSSEDLEKFIDDIHDGQYDAEIIVSAEGNNVQEESGVSSKEKDEEVVAVSERFQISFPQLLGYFLKSLR